MTKIIEIPRMIKMTGDWDVKRTRMSRMTGLTGITTIMDKSLGTLLHFWGVF